MNRWQASRSTIEPLVRNWLTSDSVLSQFMRGASTAVVIAVGSRFISFPITIALARILGTEDFGRYVLAMNWVGIFLVVGTMGFEDSLLRFVPTYAAAGEWGLLRGVLRRSSQIVLTATLALSVIVAIAVLLARRLINDESMALTFLAGCIVLPLAGQNEIRRGALRAVNWLVLTESLTQIVSPVLHALAVFAVFLALGRNISSEAAVLLRAFVEIGALVLGTVVLARVLPRQVKLTEAVYRTREWITVSVPLSLVSGMLILISSIDAIIVGMMLGPAAAGVYAVASNLARFTTFGLVASNTAAQPMIARLYSRGDTRGLSGLVIALVWMSALLAFAVGIVLVVFHKPLLHLFGSDFAEGATVLITLVAGRAANAITGPSGSLLAMTKHQDVNALILGVSVVVSIPLTIAGVALFGLQGAAFATIASLTLATIWTWIEVRRRLGINSSVFAGLPWSGR